MKALTSWPVPAAMIALFAVLIWNSEAGLPGVLAALVGLTLVLVFWSLFREMSFHAEISRALSIGDSAAAHRLIDAQLRRRRGRAPFALYKAMAHELDGRWRDCLAACDEASPDELAKAARASWQLVAGCLRAGALCELGDATRAQAVYDAEVVPRATALGPGGSPVAQLCAGRLHLASGRLDDAKAALAPLPRHMRLGPAQRAMAHYYLAKLADASDDSALARAERGRAAALAPTTVFGRPAGAAEG